MTDKKPKPNKLKKVETEPDAWERFQRAMDKIVPPKRPTKAGAGEKPKPKKQG